MTRGSAFATTDPVGVEYLRMMRARCFKWYPDPKNPKEAKRGPWDVAATAQGVMEVADYEGDGAGRPCIGRGVDGNLWIYQGGVWRPGQRRIHEIIVGLLNDHYSPARQMATEKFLAGSENLPVIESEPASAWLNFRNGLLDWRTGTLVPHTPTVLSTVQLGCDWNPEAQCERWLEFLNEVIPVDSHDAFQEVCGYLMMSGEPLNRAFMFNGTGRNGKGTVLSTLIALLGAENVSHISVQKLGENRFAAAGLFGKQANIVGDMSASFVRETDTFKSATGGDSIDAEHKGKDAFQFRPFASHVFATNKLPMFADTSPGFLERWIVVPFPNTIPAEKRDPDLKAKLCEPAELEGIAVWAVAGLQRLMARGRFALSPAMDAAKEEFSIAINPVRGFLKECAAGDPTGWVKCTEVYSVYAAWLKEQQRKGAGRNQFYAEVETLGLPRGKHDGYDVFRGLRLTKTVFDFMVDIW